MPPPSPATLRLINLADSLREEAAARLGARPDDAALTDPPGEPGQWWVGRRCEGVTGPYRAGRGALGVSGQRCAPGRSETHPHRHHTLAKQDRGLCPRPLWCPGPASHGPTTTTGSRPPRFCGLGARPFPLPHGRPAARHAGRPHRGIPLRGVNRRHVQPGGDGQPPRGVAAVGESRARKRWGLVLAVRGVLACPLLPPHSRSIHARALTHLLLHRTGAGPMASRSWQFSHRDGPPGPQNPPSHARPPWQPRPCQSSPRAWLGRRCRGSLSVTRPGRGWATSLRGPPGGPACRHLATPSCRPCCHPTYPAPPGPGAARRAWTAPACRPSAGRGA
jgi:hypothetical protein